jgi:cytochrome c biogenesis protein
MLIILAGAILGAMTGFIAQEMVPSGGTFQVKNIIDSGAFAASQVPKDWSVRVNRFWIDYTPQGGIDQFYSTYLFWINRNKRLIGKLFMSISRYATEA